MLEALDNGVFIIWLPGDETNPENRLTLDLINQISGAFLSAVSQNATCIVTASRSRFYCNGVDLQAKQTQRILLGLEKLCTLFLASSVPTVALINGHAFGAGLLLALAHDYRLCYKAKGWLCVPAIDLRITLPRALLKLAQVKLTAPIASTVLLGGQRYGGEEAVRLGIVHEIMHSLDDGLEFAQKKTRSVEKRATIRATKAILYESVLEELQRPKAKL